MQLRKLGGGGGGGWRGGQVAGRTGDGKGETVKQGAGADTGRKGGGGGADRREEG